MRIVQTLLSIIGLVTISVVAAEEIILSTPHLDAVVNVVGNELIGADITMKSRGSPDESKIHVVSEDVTVSSNLEVAGIECSLCEWVLGEVYTLIDGNYSVSHIESALEDVCSHFGGFEETCKTFVDTYTPTIIQYLENQISPDVICQTIKLCQAQKEVFTASHPSGLYLEVSRVRGGMECSTCTWVMTELETLLVSQSVESFLEEELEKACSQIPMVAELCDKIVESYLPVAIKYLESQLTPAHVCSILRLCDTFSVKILNGPHILADKMVSPPELVDEVNQTPDVKWRAAHTRWSRMSVRKARGLMGTIITPASSTESRVESVSAVPDNFDGRVTFGKCIHPVRNQEQCGSCWAFSASEVLSDRFCIATHGKIDVVMSPQTLVSCDSTNMGCQGGYLDAAWEFINENGIASDVCEPYTSGAGVTGTCPKTCSDGSAVKYFKASSYKQVSGVSQIQTEIMTNGPVQVAFQVYQDFMSYSSGVYHHVSGSLLGGHAVEAVGWGVENNTPYWLIKNSWSDTWGIQGYFKIVRGSDECGIESSVYTGTPAVSSTLMVTY